MKKLLFLVHRIPYPPNKGDKIRSFHWLKGLSEKFDIYLGTFVDDPDDLQYVDRLNQYCTDVYVENLNPTIAKIKSLTGFISNKPLTIPFYTHAKMQSWVDITMKNEDISTVLVFSSGMAQFVEADNFSACRRVIDFVDMDSDKWKQYADKKSWPMSWVYHREAKTLLQYEKYIAEMFNQSLFVSIKESQFFADTINKPSVDIDYVNNGVDTSHFNSALDLPNPYNNSNTIIVFTGAMDYWANVDAVKWFANEIFPTIRQENPTVSFFIVGGKPSLEVLNLQKIDGVTVTGFVDDVRPYIKYANLAVAPMRIARGIQNKVLEAMSMGKRVIVTDQGLEGVKAEPGRDLILANSGQEWKQQITRCLVEFAAENTLSADTKLNNPVEIVSKIEMEKNARECVLKHYSWQANIEKLSNCLFDNVECAKKLRVFNE